MLGYETNIIKDFLKKNLLEGVYMEG